MATVPPAPRAGPAPVPRRRRRRGRLLQAAAAALAALALPRGGAAKLARPEDLLGVDTSERCRVEFDAKGFPEAVISFNPMVTETFSDWDAFTTLATWTDDIAEVLDNFFAVGKPNMAITGWRKKKKGGEWKKAYTVVTGTGMTWDSDARKEGTLKYGVKQFPRQAGVTKNFGGKNLAGKTVELRFCTMFKDGIRA